MGTKSTLHKMRCRGVIFILVWGLLVFGWQLMPAGDGPLPEKSIIEVDSDDSDNIGISVQLSSSNNPPRRRLRGKAYGENSLPPPGDVPGLSGKSLYSDFSLVQGRMIGADDRERLSIIDPGISLTNYPNPFNPETTISFVLPADSHVRLEIYNLRGQLVRTLVEGFRPAGSHSANWDGRDTFNRETASGIYLYRLITEGGTETRKMQLIK